MPKRGPGLMLVIALPFACAAPAPRPAASVAAGDANRAPADAALSPEAARPTRVDGAAARRLVAEGAKLVDVRDAESYARGHIAGAINVPVDEIAARAALEIGPAGTAVVVYCSTGKRSAKAAATLAALGYERVYDLGSDLNWKETKALAPRT